MGIEEVKPHAASPTLKVSSHDFRAQLEPESSLPGIFDGSQDATGQFRRLSEEMTPFWKHPPGCPVACYWPNLSRSPAAPGHGCTESYPRCLMEHRLPGPYGHALQSRVSLQGLSLRTCWKHSIRWHQAPQDVKLSFGVHLVAVRTAGSMEPLKVLCGCNI